MVTVVAQFVPTSLESTVMLVSAGFTVALLQFLPVSTRTSKSLRRVGAFHHVNTLLFADCCCLFNYHLLCDCHLCSFASELGSSGQEVCFSWPIS